MGALEKKRQAMAGAALNHQELHLGKSLKRVKNGSRTGRRCKSANIMGKRSQSLVEGCAAGTGRSSGLARAPRNHGERSRRAPHIRRQGESYGMKHVVLLGMGGSAWRRKCFKKPLAMRRAIPSCACSTVLIRRQFKPSRTAWTGAHGFIISSKSGTTTDADFWRLFYFWDKLKKLGAICGRTLSPSPIPARRWSSSPKREIFAGLSMRRQKSAGAIRR